MMNFAEFFQTIQGYPPFPWQEEAARRLTGPASPLAVSVPTACGKTALIDAAVWAAAWGGPRRIAFIIDRRVVVDAAFERAQRIAEALQDESTLSTMAERLGPVQVVRLRGGVPGDDDWVLYPERVTVLVSTVDQIGSRLLHRGYGVSPRMAPMHAGFVGSEAIYLVDEAHLSSAFLATLRAAIHYGADVRVVPMTATPTGMDTALGLSAADRAHPLLQKRLGAVKQAELRTAPPAEVGFIKALHDAVRELAEPGRVLGVVVNRVGTARRLWQALVNEGRDSLLLTGRVRPQDRDATMAAWWPRIRAGRERGLEAGLILVATQTIEVGADIDFDALVTEAASLEALRQRFGRLDRLGTLGVTPAMICYREVKPDDRGQSPPDPIYGMALHQTWAWLQSVASEARVDFGINALDRLMAQYPPPQASIPAAPQLLPAHVDLLSQTGPEAPEIDVSPWLHGVHRGVAEVSLIWRADLDPDEPERWEEILRLRPPLATEVLEIPLQAARAWLEGSRPGDITDLEGLGQESFPGEQAGQPLLVWRGPDDSEIIRSGAIHAGDTLILPAAYGGCDQYGWNPDHREPVTDLADWCSLARGRGHSLRLVPGLTAWLGSAESAMLSAVAEVVAAETEVDPETGIDADRLAAAHLTLRERLSRCPHPLVQAFQGRYEVERHPKGVVLRGRVLDEIGASLTGGVAVALSPHLEGVADQIRQLAPGHPAQERLVRAARLHDLGKSEPRFQSMLYGHPVHAAGQPPLAKSGLRRLDQLRAAFAQSGLPRGFRHELASLLYSQETDPLVRHLVATHHGYGRPWFPASEDPEAPGANLPALGSGWVADFAAHLAEFGPWRLAAMELYLRAADARQSMIEQETKDD